MLLELLALLLLYLLRLMEFHLKCDYLLIHYERVLVTGRLSKSDKTKLFVEFADFLLKLKVLVS